MSNPTVARIDHPVPVKNDWLEWSYRIGVACKGLTGILQLLAGLGLLLTPADWAMRFAQWLAEHRLANSPDDPIAHEVLAWAARFGPNVQHFYTIFLIGHGVLMCWLAWSLLRRLNWAFPWAILILAGFVVYQLVEYSLRSDPTLLFLTSFDLIVIFLIVMERRRLPPEDR